MNFRFSVNASHIAKQLGQRVDAIAERVRSEVANLSIAAHAFVINKAQTELTGYNRKAFLGENNKNVRWVQVSNNIWVVELDESARYIEEGRCVCYSNRTNAPSVLTPNGYRNILDIKVGDYVLNQYGKWTKVLQVHDRPLVDNITLKWHKVQASKWPKQRVKVATLECIGTCPTCGFTKKCKKWNRRLLKQSCPECLQRQLLVSLTPKHGARRGDKLILTAEHQVLTQRGWRKAKDLSTNDLVAYPSYQMCLSCGIKPVHWGAKVCSQYCAGVLAMKSTIKRGRHVCQNPRSRSEYHKRMAKLGKTTSKAEDLAAQHIIECGLSVGWPGDNTDCIRQYPVPSRVSHDRQYYYYADFFFPKWNLILEIDGPSWHKKNAVRDRQRDYTMKAMGLQVIRLDATRFHRNDKQARASIESIVNNHADRINNIYTSAFIKKYHINSKFSSMRRRWDITVEHGESFVCNGLVIHNSSVFMDWLLNNNPKAKTAKDGSTYAHIPFTHERTPASRGHSTRRDGTSPVLSAMVQAALKREKISLRKIVRNPDGTPKLGIIRSLSIEAPGPQSQYPDLFSAPRSSEMSRITGLPAHEGIFKLQDAVIVQRETAKGKVSREVVTFRTISSKHRVEGRWYAPRIEPFNSLKAAHEWAMEEWGKIVQQLHDELRR